jgi:hypothetical protein
MSVCCAAGRNVVHKNHPVITQVRLPFRAGLGTSSPRAVRCPFRLQQADGRRGPFLRYPALFENPWSPTPGPALEDRHEVAHATRLELLDHVW